MDETSTVAPAESGDSSQNPTLQKILGAASNAFSSVAQKISRGRGRPRKDGQPNRSATVVPVEFPQAAVPSPAPVVPAMAAPEVKPIIGTDLIQRCIEAFAKRGARAAARAIRSAAIRKTADVAFADQIVKDLELTDEEAKDISELVALLIEKYKVTTEYFLELSLALTVLGIGARFYTAFQELNSRSEPEKEMAA